MEKPKRSRKKASLSSSTASSPPIIVIKSPLVGKAADTKPLSPSPSPSPKHKDLPKLAPIPVQPTPPPPPPPKHKDLPKLAPIPVQPIPSSPVVKPITLDQSFNSIKHQNIQIKLPKRQLQRLPPPLESSPPPPSYSFMVNKKHHLNTPASAPVSIKAQLQPQPQLLFKNTHSGGSIHELEKKRTHLRQLREIELDRIKRKRECIQQLEKKQKEAELLKNIQLEKVYLAKLEEERKKLEKLEYIRKTQLKQQLSKHIDHHTSAPNQVKQTIDYSNTKRILKHIKETKYSPDGIPLVNKSKKRVQFEGSEDLEGIEVDKGECEEIQIDSKKSKWKVDNLVKGKGHRTDKEKHNGVDSSSKTKTISVVLDDDDDDELYVAASSKNKAPTDLKYNKTVNDNVWNYVGVVKDKDKTKVRELTLNLEEPVKSDLKINKIKAKLLEAEVFNNPEKFKKTELLLFNGISCNSESTT
jgi:hypothetical protein